MTHVADRPQKRVLLVEDDPQVGAMLADMLEGANYRVDGPHGTLADGVAALAMHFPDCAVLDVRLHRRTVSLLAEDLDLYGIPYLLCSGLPLQDRMAELFRGHPFIAKHMAFRDLIPTVQALVQ